MSRLAWFGALAVLLGFAMINSTSAEEPQANNPNLGKVRHVVMFKFKDGTSADQIKTIADAFRALPSKIPGIIGFEWGTNVSPEKHSQGYTHCFLLTFPDETARDAYLPHPAHKAFGKLAGPYFDKVLVIDFVAKP
ncbi:MAG: Dabb family protein [Thermoguttaceae bacterium]|jgi:hypothetical protein